MRVPLVPPSKFCLDKRRFSRRELVIFWSSFAAVRTEHAIMGVDVEVLRPGDGNYTFHFLWLVEFHYLSLVRKNSRFSISSPDALKILTLRDWSDRAWFYRMLEFRSSESYRRVWPAPRHLSMIYSDRVDTEW